MAKNRLYSGKNRLFLAKTKVTLAKTKVTLGKDRLVLPEVKVSSTEAIGEIRVELKRIAESQQDRPDATWRVIDQSTDGVLAQCSLWWRETPFHEGQRIGAIGHFSAASPEAARMILAKAISELRGQGCALAVGPMDGNTWRKYRLVTERGTEPPFFLEPDNPPQYPQYFLDNGFAPIAHYYSALAEDLANIDPRAERAWDRLAAQGIQMRQLRPEKFEEELGAIYEISRKSFDRNFLYTEISREEFIRQYTPIVPHVIPQLVLLAERDGTLVGFSFSIPNLAQAQRGQSIDTVILKSMAILPERSCAGLGVVLMARTHELARELHYRRVIHALMHESNSSLAMSGHYGPPFRRYTLYSLRLGK